MNVSDQNGYSLEHIVSGHPLSDFLVTKTKLPMLKNAKFQTSPDVTFAFGHKHRLLTEKQNRLENIDISLFARD